jgi:ribosomal protein S18 acetylase RimI-like enzyme
VKLAIEPASAPDLAEIATWVYGPPYEFRPDRIKLSVAAFNDRARMVYERAGFAVVGRHTRRFERWGEVEFNDMEEA